MRFGQLIEYNRNILLKNHTQNVLEKLFPDPYLKNQNWAYLWINSVKFQTVCFYCMLIWGLSKYSGIETETEIEYAFLQKSYTCMLNRVNLKKVLSTEHSSFFLVLCNLRKVVESTKCMVVKIITPTSHFTSFWPNVPCTSLVYYDSLS